MINFYEFCKIINENFTRDEVANHPDMNKLTQYLKNIELKINQAEESKNIQELNNIKKELESQMRDNKMALSQMNPQDRQRNVYLTAVSANIQGKWEYLTNVIDRVQNSIRTNY
jgi:arginine repressor